MKLEKYCRCSFGVKVRGFVFKDVVKWCYKVLLDYEFFFGCWMQVLFDWLEFLQGKWLDIEIIYWCSYQLFMDIGYQFFGLCWQDFDDIYFNYFIESVKDCVRNYQ